MVTGTTIVENDEAKSSRVVKRARRRGGMVAESGIDGLQEERREGGGRKLGVDGGWWMVVDVFRRESLIAGNDLQLCGERD
jgi:hypothetical protein